MCSTNDNIFERFACGSGPSGSSETEKEHCSTSAKESNFRAIESSDANQHGFPRVIYKSGCGKDGQAVPVALRLLIVGHNPSDVSWNRGHYYANPNNWMWRILQETGMVDKGIVRSCEQDVQMPHLYSIGFTDVGGGVRGTQSSTFSDKHIYEKWRGPFYETLREICESTCNALDCSCSLCGCPSIIAFAGMKQFVQLFEARQRHTKHDEAVFSTDDKVRLSSVCPEKVHFGRQYVLPRGWPLDAAEVWVLPSTSGAAAMTRRDRFAPWEKLADRLSKIEHPRKVVCKNERKRKLL